MQEELLKSIVRVLPKNTSLNQAIATALGISYDAAHRRTSNKSKFSLDESVQLANAFQISLDSLRAEAQQDMIPVQKTTQIESCEDLEMYFKNSAESVRKLATVKEAKLFYSAKDIPIFYVLDGDLLTRFKIYVWLRLLSPAEENIPFNSYKIPLSTIETAKELGLLYAKIPKTEIWDPTTFNSTLKQIHFYFQAGQLDSSTAIELCTLLSNLLDRLCLRVQASNKDFLLYHNELLLMNNTVLIHTPHSKAFYVPFTFLSYFLATDTKTCDQAYEYISKQLSHSKLLNTSGEKECNLFFKKLRQKVSALKKLIEATEILEFE